MGGNHLIISFILSTRLISKLATEDVVLDAVTSVSVRSGEPLSLETILNPCTPGVRCTLTAE